MFCSIVPFAEVICNLFPIYFRQFPRPFHIGCAVWEHFVEKYFALVIKAREPRGPFHKLRRQVVKVLVVAGP